MLEFASANQFDHPMEFYCNYGDLLTQFVLYFKEQAKGFMVIGFNYKSN